LEPTPLAGATAVVSCSGADGLATRGVAEIATLKVPVPADVVAATRKRYS
jgi:hypothetical protein